MPGSWYIAREGKQIGPVTAAEFEELVRLGHLLPTDYVWGEGCGEWQLAGEFLQQFKELRREARTDVAADKGLNSEPVKKSEERSVTGRRIFWIFVVLIGCLIAWGDRNSLLYRMGGALNGAVFGAIGGGLGGVLSFFFERFFKRTIPQSWKVGTVSVGVCLGFLFGKVSEVGIGAVINPAQEAAYKEVVRPKIDRMYVVRSLRNAGDAGQLYRTLEEKEPATFDAIVQVLASKLRSDATQDEIIGLIRQQFIERISVPRMGYLRDDELLQLYGLLVDTMGALAISNPRQCLLMAQGKPFGDLRPYVGREILQREQPIMERLLETKPRQISLLPKDELQEINKKVILALYNVYGNSIEVLDPAKQVAGQEKAACLMFKEYLRTILSLNRNEALALFRAMLLDPARLE
jgi:hypothetical protein